MKEEVIESFSLIVKNQLENELQKSIVLLKEAIFFDRIEKGIVENGNDTS